MPINTGVPGDLVKSCLLYTSNKIAIEMHVRMPGSLSLYEAHEHATHIERRLKQHFGADTHVGIHLEPIKVNGKYQKPE